MSEPIHARVVAFLRAHPGRHSTRALAGHIYGDAWPPSAIASINHNITIANRYLFDTGEKIAFDPAQKGWALTKLERPRYEPMPARETRRAPSDPASRFVQPSAMRFGR